MNELKVYYPHGGKHFLLHYWTYNERGRIILSKTEEGVKAVANRIFKEHSDAEIKAYLEVDIVAPSKLHQKLAEALRLQEKIDGFHYEIISRLRDILEAGKKLPELFKFCSNYEVSKEDKKNISCPSSWEEKHHYLCKNCSETIVLGMSKADCYTKYHDAWRKIYPIKPYEHSNRFPSRAEVAKDDEELYFADAAFGHHSSGIDLNKIDLSQDQTYSSPYLTERLLFMFRKVRELDMTEMQTKLDQQKKLLKESQTKNDKARESERKQEEQDRIAMTISFFKDQQ